jgi:hypothetical protein
MGSLLYAITISDWPNKKYIYVRTNRGTCTCTSLSSLPSTNQGLVKDWNVIEIYSESRISWTKCEWSLDDDHLLSTCTCLHVSLVRNPKPWSH